MSFEIIFRREAEMGLIDIRDYYNKISANVSSNFFKEFFETLNFIEQKPKLFQIRYGASE